MSVTSIRLEDDLNAPLKQAMHNMQRTKAWIINEALRQYLQNQQLEQQRWQDTMEALEDIRNGNVIDSGEVHAWLKSWGDKKPLKAPKK